MLPTAYVVSAQSKSFRLRDPTTIRAVTMTAATAPALKALRSKAFMLSLVLLIPKSQSVVLWNRVRRGRFADRHRRVLRDVPKSHQNRIHATGRSAFAARESHLPAGPL